MLGVEYVECTTQSDYLCSGQIFAEEGFSTPCTKLEYSGKELDDYLIDGFPEIVQFNKVDDRFFTIELDHPDFSWNKKPTIMLSYRFDIPEKTLVHQETIMVSLMDLIGIVGGTLSLYVGFTFQIIEYCMIIVGKIKEIVKHFKFEKVSSQKKDPEHQQEQQKQKQHHQRQKESLQASSQTCCFF